MDKLKNYLFLEDPNMFSLVEEVSSYSSILVIECEDLSFLDFVISFKDEYYPLVELLDTSIRLVLSSIKHMSLPTIWILMSRYRNLYFILVCSYYVQKMANINKIPIHIKREIEIEAIKFFKMIQHSDSPIIG